MLGAIGKVTTILGVLFFKTYLKDIEVRRVFMLGCAFGICATWSQWLFALRLNVKLGIPDLVYIVLTDTIFGALGLAMGTLPMMAMFAKITPKKIEGTVFAFLTGTVNFAHTVISPMIGVWINKNFVGVTSKNLKNYSTLCFIVFVCSFFGFLVLPLIPLKTQIMEWKEKRRESKFVFDPKDLNNKNEYVSINADFSNKLD